MRKPGEMLKRWRLQRGLSQEDLAKNLGVNRSTICRLEKGNGGPSVHTAYAIAKASEQGVPVEAWKRVMR